MLAGRPSNATLGIQVENEDRGEPEKGEVELGKVVDGPILSPGGVGESVQVEAGKPGKVGIEGRTPGRFDFAPLPHSRAETPLPRGGIKLKSPCRTSPARPHRAIRL